MAYTENQKASKILLRINGIFRDHIHNYAAIAYPLTETLHHGKPDKIIWGEAQHHAFGSLQRALISKPVLRPPDLSKDYIIFADASTVALSAILMQRDEETGTNYVVSYASRKLLPRERKQPATVLELNAVIFALTKFDHWVYARKIHVFTNHRPIQWLNSLAKQPEIGKVDSNATSL